MYPPVGTVFWDIMTTKDLIFAMLSTLKEYNPREAQASMEFYRGVIDALEQGDTPEPLAESALIEDLFCTLNEIAPKGHYFGAHPDDESNVGFWPCDCSHG